ncbi:PD-(D/E)XK nuclease-like domain-containing protein [Aliarcobacter cryaerophilus]|uniref:PD-(D/E)XK nuclease-like domain-containing protein n=1 Tax=Aliarcobacter cryaerophilus TaxID=28198 RepID=UPI0021B3C87D|nr:PD-(D/E)XK nuclease-like domain-containing protein [Aliarcobacter cryaerophilus]MCT7432452.1 PD-(D/E)XK nuclease-like domain-containing protein [Aliarcobacter cryaerophilus]
MSKNDLFNINIKEKSFKYPLDTMIEGLSNQEYHSAGGVSSTSIPILNKSVRAFMFRHLLPKWKPCFDRGNLIHDCILLPELVENTYIESPTVGMDTVAANKLRAENPDKIVVGKGDIELYRQTAKIARIIFPFLAYPTTKTEVSFFHHNKDIDLILQIRPDIYNPEIGMLYDVKSTKASNHSEFEKIIEGYNYDLSLAYYFDVLNMMNFKTDIYYTGWLCIPTDESNPPFVYRISEELLEKGRSKYQSLIDKYKRYIDTVKNEGETPSLIYEDVAEREAHSWEYRKENYVTAS